MSDKLWYVPYLQREAKGYLSLLTPYCGTVLIYKEGQVFSPHLHYVNVEQSLFGAAGYHPRLQYSPYLQRRATGYHPRL